MHQHLWPESLVEALAERSSAPMLRTTTLVLEEGDYELDPAGYSLIAIPIVLGKEQIVWQRVSELRLNLNADNLTIVDPEQSPRRRRFDGEDHWTARQLVHLRVGLDAHAGAARVRGESIDDR